MAFYRTTDLPDRVSIGGDILGKVGQATWRDLSELKLVLVRLGKVGRLVIGGNIVHSQIVSFSFGFSLPSCDTSHHTETRILLFYYENNRMSFKSTNLLPFIE